MADRHDANEVSLKSDVLIAPHHGGNNGSAGCFIARVDPTFLVFSAGHDHNHPSDGAAQRYLTHGVLQANMFRTDRGDDERGSFEWKAGAIAGCTDARGDDDVEIVVTDTGTLSVAYREAHSGC